MDLEVLGTVLALVAAVSADIKIPGVFQGVELTEEEMQAMVDEHNALRTLVANGYKGHGPVADMLRMKFSPSLQDNAQRQAADCGGPPHGNHPMEGQNYQEGAQSTIMKAAIQDWFHNEQANYRFGGLFTTRNGHFTQMIWANTDRIGCGARQCAGTTRLVCNYMRLGNYQTRDPYKKGRPCSACPLSHPFCYESLCSTAEFCKGKKCECLHQPEKCINGKFDQENCKCVCNKGHTGLNCAEECRDAEYSGCYGRFKKNHCSEKSTYYDDAVKNCKPECRLCKAKCVDYIRECEEYKRYRHCKQRWVIAVCSKTCGYCK